MTQTGPTHQWRQLVAAAVLGIDRAGTRLPAIDGEPARLVPVAADDDAAALLRRAAVLSVYERAGRRTEPAAADGLACEPDPMPPCSFQSGQKLARILHGDLGFLLDEWCALAVNRGVRAPGELLPALLERLLAAKDGPNEAGLAVLGRRGQWLAGLNPTWKGIVGSDSSDVETVWKTGEKEQRLGLFRRLHRTDARAARELLASTWTQEDGDDRAAFVSSLAHSLSADDEAFLEAALDDGRKPVRQAAAELLARLSDSAFCKRMSDRALACVTMVTKKGLVRGGKLVLEVTLPDKADKSLLRDGVEKKRSGAMGEQAHVLSQIIAATPLKLWSGCGASLKEILALAEKSDWREPLILGWARAAIRQSSAEWAEALIQNGLESKDGLDFESFGDLIGALDPVQRERVLTEILRSGTVEPSIALKLLEFCNHPWSDAFSKKAVAAMRGYFGSPQSYSAHDLRSTLKQFIVRYLSPSVAAEIEKGWNRTSDHWHSGDEELVSTLAATLAFRRSMHEEFSK